MKLDVDVPPLNEQKRIVAKVEALQEHSSRAREALESVGPLLERFRQSVLAAAFRGDLTREWREQNPDVEPAHVLLERIRDERRTRWIEDAAEKGRARAEAKAAKAGKLWTEEDDEKTLAKEVAKAEKKYKEPTYSSAPNAPTASKFGFSDSTYWASSPLEGLVDPERGIPYGIVKTGDPFPNGVPTVRCGDIKDFHMNADQLKLVSPEIHRQYQRTELRGGEVLVAIRGTVGATAVVPNYMTGMNISREVAMIPLLDGIVPKYLMYLLASPIGQALMAGHVKGVAQSGINLADIRQLPIPIPPSEEQSQIVELLDVVLSSLNATSLSVTDKRSLLSKLNQSILAKAFRGELVSQDPNDEPASVLLERIKAEREAAAPKKKKATRRKK